MKIGDLVRIKQLGDPRYVGKVPPPDVYWGETAVVRWKNGDIEEITVPDKNLEVIA